MKEVLHGVYVFVGHCFCQLCLIYWRIRDKVFPPKEKAVLFVAHPDDDTLFFHTFIKEHKPYVVLLTAGWSLRRLPCFFKAMRHYGVKYRAYDMDTRDKREHLLQKHIQEVLSIGHFELCATHNSTGEYGHEMHIRVHDAVVSNINIPVLVPQCDECIEKYPLNEQNVFEKKDIFRNIYVTETWVIDQYTKWVENEKLEIVKTNK